MRDVKEKCYFEMDWLYLRKEAIIFWVHAHVSSFGCSIPPCQAGIVNSDYRGRSQGLERLIMSPKVSPTEWQIQNEEVITVCPPSVLSWPHYVWQCARAETAHSQAARKLERKQGLSLSWAEIMWATEERYQKVQKHPSDQHLRILDIGPQK